MRILILNDRIPPENIGGAGQVVWRLAGGLRDAGHDVHLIAATPGDPFTETRNHIPTYHLHSQYPQRFRSFLSLYNPQTIGSLRRLYNEISPDVINAHNIHADLSYYALTLAHRLRIPAVFTSHDVMPVAYRRLRHFVDPAHCGDDLPAAYRLPLLLNLRDARFRYNPFRNRIIRYILRHHARARVSVSRALRAVLETNGLPSFQPVHNGIDPEAFNVPAASLSALRTRLDLAGKRIILMAGRLSADKGSRQVLSALSRVVEQEPQTVLLLLSPYDLERAPILNEPEFRHLRGQHVRSGGWLQGDDLIAAFHLADVVTVPSIIMDSFPTVNLEAMAAGKPLVSTCYGGSQEIVVDGETGYIINPFDTATFADCLTRLLLDDDLRRGMGEAGRQRLRERFTLAEQVSRMVAVYHRAMQTGD